MIKIMHSKFNFSSREGEEIRFIVIHDTGNTSNTANAINHVKYFGSGLVGRSAHYFVDDKNIVEVVDPKNASWHCADRKSKNGCTNFNSIGVELCINPETNRNKAKANMIRLVHYLMIKYSIPPERVCRHFDVTGKICPRSMSENNWEEWKIFKRAV